MNIFQFVKSQITTRQAAEHYGLNVQRNGMTLCPFHNDHAPSLKVDTRFYCFGCQVKGDVIDFVSKLFGLSLIQAAQKLAADFGLDPNNTAVGCGCARSAARGAAAQTCAGMYESPDGL